MNFWQNLVTFILGVIAGGAGKIKIPVGVTLPKFSIEDTINVFGRNDKVTLSASGDDDNLVLEVKGT